MGDPIDVDPATRRGDWAAPSPCGRYRHALGRADPDGFLASGRSVLWVMVNPSVADATRDDHTMRKVMGFSARNALGRVVVGNLFPWVATDVGELRDCLDPLGPDADAHLAVLLGAVDAVVVAWGPRAKLPPRLRGRWREVAAIVASSGRAPLCLGTAADGQPLHPLTLGYDRALRPWATPAGG